MDFLFIIIILIMSVIIHEVAHGYAALALGDPTAKYENRLTLNPLSHIDPIGSVMVHLMGYFLGGFIIGWAKPVPFNPYNLKPERFGLPARAGEALVALAGPLSNIGIAVIFGIMIRLTPTPLNSNAAFIELAGYVVLINITLAIFNLIPLPPLDGSKILFAILPYSWYKIREFLEQFGIVFVLIFVFFVWQIMGPIINDLFRLFTGIAF